MNIYSPRVHLFNKSHPQEGIWLLLQTDKTSGVGNILAKAEHSMLSVIGWFRMGEALQAHVIGRSG